MNIYYFINEIVWENTEQDVVPNNMSPKRSFYILRILKFRMKGGYGNVLHRNLWATSTPVVLTGATGLKFVKIGMFPAL